MGRFDKVTLYMPNGGKTYCFKIPSYLKPNKRHYNTRQSNKKEAEKIRDEFLEQLEYKSKNQTYQEAYLDQAIETYLVAKKHLARRSYTAYAFTVNQFKDFVVSRLGKMPRLIDIDKPLVEAYLQSILDKGLNPHTRNDRRCIIVNFFNYALDSEWIEKNIVKKIPKMNEPDSVHPDPLTEAEVKQVLGECKRMKRDNHFQNKCYYEIMAIVYYAGTRISEALYLLKSDIDFDLHRIVIQGKIIGLGIDRYEYRTKTRKRWFAPINAELDLILRNWMAKVKDNPSPLLFPNTHGKPIKVDTVYLEVRKAMLKAGLPPERITRPLHRGRHTFTSVARTHGVEEALVQAALGHTTNIMTRHYTHLAPDHIANKFNKVSYGQNKKVKA